MTLDWTFSFISVNIQTQIQPKALLVVSFQDGKFQFYASSEKNPEIITQMDSVLTLVSYIALGFPNKDFRKIKLKTGNQQYAIHFLDKRFLTENFLGCLSVSERNDTQTFETWGVEEMMSEYIFEFFYEIYTNESLEDKLTDFIYWISNQIEDFYLDWSEARNKNSSQEISPPLSLQEKQTQFEQWWDLQLINEFGQPLTDVLSFIDNNAFIFYDEGQKINQSLESMSLSALKILIEQYGAWNIKYLKMKLQNEMGYQYILFQPFSVKNIKYLLIMNSALYDFEKEYCRQIFRGNERELLEIISHELEKSPELFSDFGQIMEGEGQDSIQSTIINYVKLIFFK